MPFASQTWKASEGNHLLTHLTTAHDAITAHAGLVLTVLALTLTKLHSVLLVALILFFPGLIVFSHLRAGLQPAVLALGLATPWSPVSATIEKVLIGSG